MNRKLTTAAIATVLIVALSACGSSTDAEPPAKNAASPSASPSSPAHAAHGAVDGREVATKMADAMLAKKTAHMSMTTNGTPTMTGDSEVGNPIKVAMKISQQGLKLEVVQVSGLLYIKGIPGTTKPWIKVDPKGTDAFSKAMASVSNEISKSSDPRALVETMEGVKGKHVGTEQVGGDSTEHYLFLIPISSYAKVLSPAGLKALKGMVKGPIANDLWVGEDNLPRKMATTMVVGGKKQLTELTYSDWGKPVNIVAPPAAQVGTPPGS